MVFLVGRLQRKLSKTGGISLIKLFMGLVGIPPEVSGLSPVRTSRGGPELHVMCGPRRASGMQHSRRPPWLNKTVTGDHSGSFPASYKAVCACRLCHLTWEITST